MSWKPLIKALAWPVIWTLIVAAILWTLFDVTTVQGYLVIGILLAIASALILRPWRRLG